jgi:hypothetical protein
MATTALVTAQDRAIAITTLLDVVAGSPAAAIFVAARNALRTHRCERIEQDGLQALARLTTAGIGRVTGDTGLAQIAAGFDRIEICVPEQQADPVAATTRPVLSVMAGGFAPGLVLGVGLVDGIEGRIRVITGERRHSVFDFGRGLFMGAWLGGIAREATQAERQRDKGGQFPHHGSPEEEGLAKASRPRRY